MINKIIKKSRKYIILQIFFSILSTIAIAIIPILHKSLIDNVIPQSSFYLFEKNIYILFERNFILSIIYFFVRKICLAYSDRL